MTPDELHEIRARHRRAAAASAKDQCYACLQQWPCDAIRLLDVLKEAAINYAVTIRTLRTSREQLHDAENEISDLLTDLQTESP